MKPTLKKAPDRPEEKTGPNTFLPLTPALMGDPFMVNGIKFFATADVLEASTDRRRLARMTATIYQHWQRKNGHNRTGAIPQKIEKKCWLDGLKPATEQA
ncbi:MAG TPA: hypothetical protein VMH30_00575 [Verrucomicrobiae bacterium]|nr:hypothetical protein [Verrucomicrobiae bacterium]